MRSEKEIRAKLKSHERFVVMGKPFLYDDRLIVKVLKWILEEN